MHTITKKHTSTNAHTHACITTQREKKSKRENRRTEREEKLQWMLVFHEKMTSEHDLKVVKCCVVC